MWEVTKLGARTLTAYDKLAVVTDRVWVQRTVKASGWMIPGEVEVIHTDDLDAAETWITS